jgi:Na+/proline symporter
MTLKMGKRFALFWGIVLTAGALLYPDQGTPVVTMALGIASFTYGGLLGGFFLGLFWKRAIQRDAILGMSVGILAMAFIVFSKQIIAVVPGLSGVIGHTIAWPWFVLIGTSITFAVGALSSMTHEMPRAG